jgi:hypothetical protein
MGLGRSLRIAERSHDHQTAHIDHQIVIAEEGAALGQKQIEIVFMLDFGYDFFHVRRVRNWPFLTLIALPVRAAATTMLVCMLK